MIIQHLHVDGFGKLTNLDLDLSDGINLIYGDNEAGKSTLCSFIFHMLYGMERSRGKASRFDAYKRFLPWKSAVFGGSLIFEADGFSWLLERSFLAENRYLRLTRLDDGANFADAESHLTHLLGDVNELAYRSMFMLSQQTCADISSLAAILRQYTQNLPGSGSTAYSPTQAVKELNRQKRALTSQLSDVKRGALYRIEEELADVRQNLQALASRECAETESEIETEADSVSQRSPRAGLTQFFYLLLFISGVVLLIRPLFSATPDTELLRFLPSALCFVTGLFILLFNSVKRKKASLSTDISMENEEIDHHDQIEELLAREESLINQKRDLEKLLCSDEALRQQISALQLAIDRISSLSTEIHHTYSPNLQRIFARHASTLTGRPFSQILIDESFHFSLLENDHIVPLEALSHGTIEQLMFACRLASIQLLHEDAELPVLLDDVFALTDDSRLTTLLYRLSADYPSQKLIFSCQKREAVILSQHSLSYHLIRL